MAVDVDRCARRSVGHISLQILQKLREQSKLVSYWFLTPVARRIACGERKSNFGRCGVGRGDGAWWFLGALVTTGRTRLSKQGDFTTRLDFAGSTPSYETGPFSIKNRSHSRANQHLFAAWIL